MHPRPTPRGSLLLACAGAAALPLLAAAAAPSPAERPVRDAVAAPAPPVGGSALPPGAPNAPGLALKPTENAALFYWRAWHLMPAKAAATVEDGRQSLAEAPYGAVKGGNAWDPAMLAALAELQLTIDTIARGAALPGCDFGPDWSQGPAMLLPELTLLRRSTRLLDADARRLASLGRADDAADRIVAILRLADHAGQNTPLIGHLVAVAIASLGCASAEALAQTGQLSGPARDRLLAAVEAARTSPSFNARRALEWERQVSLGWLRAELARRPARDFLKDAGAFLNPDRPLNELPGVPAGDDAATKTELLRQAETAAALVDRLITAWDTPQADAVIEQVQAEADRLAKTQPVVAMMVAPMSRVRASGQRLAATIGDTAKVLRAAKLAADPASR